MPIVTSLGLTMPKTSSRAITSPAGTADTMETLAPVDLDVATMRRVVEREGGCIAWGGAVRLSPADDILIRVERALDLDSEGQMIASVLSKKIAAGSTHLVIDMPVGPTAKVRSAEDAAASIAQGLIAVAARLSASRPKIVSPGRPPADRPRHRAGAGSARRAGRAAMRSRRAADLRDRAVVLAGALLELAGAARKAAARRWRRGALDDGQAWVEIPAHLRGARRHAHAAHIPVSRSPGG